MSLAEIKELADELYEEGMINELKRQKESLLHYGGCCLSNRDRSYLEHLNLLISKFN